MRFTERVSYLLHLLFFLRVDTTLTNRALTSITVIAVLAMFVVTFSLHIWL